MKTRLNQSGFGAVELIIILVIVAGLGFVGYKVMNSQQDKTASDNSQSNSVSDPTKATDVTPAPTINSTSDLDKASSILDKTDPGKSNSTDTNQLDSQLSSV